MVFFGQLDNGFDDRNRPSVTWTEGDWEGTLPPWADCPLNSGVNFLTLSGSLSGSVAT